VCIFFIFKHNAIPCFSIDENISKKCLRHYATSQKVTVSIPDIVGFYNLHNSSRGTGVLGAEVSTRSLSDGKGQPAHKSDSLTAICEPIV
jgi:hypothetical protein